MEKSDESGIMASSSRQKSTKKLTRRTKQEQQSGHLGPD